MTISDIYQPVVVPVSGVGPYSFPFSIIQANDLFVLIDGVFQPSGSYVVVLSGSAPIYSGGTMTFYIAPTGLEVTIGRITDATQDTVYQPYTPFPAATTEFNFDKLTLLVQEDTGGGGGGIGPGFDSDPVFNSVTIANPSPVLVLQDGTGQLARFGASAGPGNPGIEYSDDNGSTWSPMFTFTDFSDPGALGETQVYGPDGAGSTTAYMTTVTAMEVWFWQNLRMQNNKGIYGLIDPVDTDQAANKGYVDAVAGGGGSLTPTFQEVTIQDGSPVLILDNTGGGFARFGASIGVGNPGIEISPDSGVTWLPVLTTTDMDNPAAYGEVQIYGPDGLGNNTAYIVTTTTDQETWFLKNVNMKLNRLRGLLDPLVADEAATKGYVDATAGGAPDLDPVFNSVTVQNPNPVYVLDDGTGQLTRIGASAGAGNPGFEYSPDSGVTWLPMFTFTDSSDPLAIGETQMYGPDGGGGTEAFLTTVQLNGGEVYIWRKVNMNANAIYGLPDAINGNEPVTLSQYNSTLASSLANISHNTLLNLGADDHTQYFNQARGDVRYVRNSQVAVAGAAVAGGKIISDGFGSQSIANTFGITSCTISGDLYQFTLAEAIPNVNDMVITATGLGGLVIVTTATIADNSTTFRVALSYYDPNVDPSVQNPWTPATLNGFQINFTVHNAGA